MIKQSKHKAKTKHHVLLISVRSNGVFRKFAHLGVLEYFSSFLISTFHDRSDGKVSDVHVEKGFSQRQKEVHAGKTKEAVVLILIATQAA